MNTWLKVIAISTLLMPAFSHAKDMWHLGVSLGTANYGGYYRDSYQIPPPNVPSVTAVTSENTATGYDLFGGYAFNSYFWLDVHYLYMGTIGAHVTFSPPFQPTSANAYAKFSGESVDAMLRYPLNATWTIYGRTGLVNAHFENQAIEFGPCAIFGGVQTCNGVSERVFSSRRTTYDIAAGIDFHMTSYWLMRVEYVHYHHVTDGDMQPNDGTAPSVDFLSLSFVCQI